MLMKEFTAKQIAAALQGHPGSAEQELRLLRLFDTPSLPSPASGGGEIESSPARGAGKIETQARDLKKAA
jgi:hypothetical protein